MAYRAEWYNAYVAAGSECICACTYLDMTASRSWDPMEPISEDFFMDAPIDLVKICEAEAVAGSTSANSRPDLSARIKVLFSHDEEYIAMYLNHGQSKITFSVVSDQLSSRFHGKVLKVARRIDREPSTFRACRDIFPEVYYECWGRDGQEQYHCWIAERCIPVNEFLKHAAADYDKCILAACRCIARAAENGFHFYDCHYFNIGVRIATTAGDHQVVIIDAGSNGLSHKVLAMSKVNQCMNSLWWWTRCELNIHRPRLRTLWNNIKGLSDLHGAIQRLNVIWAASPCLTKSAMTTAEVDNVLFEKWARAHLEYCGTKAFKLIQLLGTSACKGSWSVRMSAFCFQAGNDLNARLTQAQVRVIKELYERITTVRKENITRDRTAEEINNTMTFWWKLQRYREYWLEMNRRKDTAAVILTDKEVAEVKQNMGRRRSVVQST